MGIDSQEMANLKDDFNDLSDIVFCKLMNLKTAKMDYRDVLIVRFAETGRLYTDREKMTIVRKAKREYEDLLKEFRVLWKARRFYYKAIRFGFGC